MAKINFFFEFRNKRFILFVPGETVTIGVVFKSKAGKHVIGAY